MSDAWLGPVVGVVALTLFLGWNIRFLLQGRWYRRLDAAQRAELRQADERWEAYHGRRLPWTQLVVGILVALGVLGYLVGRDLGLLGR
jgi:hypothetical protein